MYVGHMHGDKGIDFLLRVSARLGKMGIKMLFWGGKDRHISSFEDTARRLGIGESVEFVPFQPPRKMHRALAEKASVCVVMLRDTYYNRYLTCPVKALDYLSHGIPTIGSDLPSVREVLGYAGTYVDAGDVDGFIRAVDGLLNNPGQYNEMAALCLRRADKISWENRARTIIDFVKGHG